MQVLLLLQQLAEMQPWGFNPYRRRTAICMLPREEAWKLGHRGSIGRVMAMAMTMEAMEAGLVWCLCSVWQGLTQHPWEGGSSGQAMHSACMQERGMQRDRECSGDLPWMKRAGRVEKSWISLPVRGREMDPSHQLCCRGWQHWLWMPLET